MAPDILQYASLPFPRSLPEFQRRDLDRAQRRISELEAENAKLRQEADEAIMLAEGPSTLKEIAAGFVARGMENARLREALQIADDDIGNPKVDLRVTHGIIKRALAKEPKS